MINNILYITEQGTQLHKHGGSIILKKDGQIIAQEKMINITNICLFGNIQISTQAIAALLNDGIDTAFLTLNGRLKGKLSPAKPKNINLRINQFHYHFSPFYKTYFPSLICLIKLKNSISTLSIHLKNHPEISQSITNNFYTIEKQIDNINKAIDEIKPDTKPEKLSEIQQSILGFEGASAQAYFDALSKCFRQDSPFKMNGRTRRPPQDPINTLLSLGYSFLVRELNALLEALGFEPYIGFMHSPKHARPSLALDLIEQLRQPCIDHFVLRVINLNSFTPSDFQIISKYIMEDDEDDEDIENPKQTNDTKKTQGYYLSKDGFKKFIPLYEKWMRTPFTINLESNLSSNWIKSTPLFNNSSIEDDKIIKIQSDWRTLIRYYTAALASFIAKQNDIKEFPLLIFKRS